MRAHARQGPLDTGGAQIEIALAALACELDRLKLHVERVQGLLRPRLAAEYAGIVIGNLLTALHGGEGDIRDLAVARLRKPILQEADGLRITDHAHAS